MEFKCGDCGDTFEADEKPGEYSWPTCSCPEGHYQLLGWQEVGG